jgi:hypothetical protein
MYMRIVMDSTTITEKLQEAQQLANYYVRGGFDPSSFYHPNGNHNPGTSALVAAVQIQREYGGIVTGVTHKRSSDIAKVYVLPYSPELEQSMGSPVEIEIPVNRKDDACNLLYALCMLAETNHQKYKGQIVFRNMDTHHAKENISHLLN